MKIAILGYGVEGKSVENYFKNKASLTIFKDFEELPDTSGFDLVFRSPSVAPPKPEPENYTSITKYFFEHSPAEIIAVTGTKGKGTTCSLLATLLKSLGQTVYLAGNIGTPALDLLDRLEPSDVVVYETSSFQAWDLRQSPRVAGVLRIEPDHLDKHADFEDYVSAKGNLVRYQTEDDYCVFYNLNPDSKRIAALSDAKKLTYPLAPSAELTKVLDYLKIPGEHNRENAEAALLLASAYFDQPLEEFLADYDESIRLAFENFQGLPHRLEFVRELNGVRFYDDNFSSAYPAMDVALKTFADQPLVLIAGGKDRGLDYTMHRDRIFSQTPNLVKAILIGEIKEQLAEGIDSSKYAFADTLEEAVNQAYGLKPKVILMSPGAPSFDMFKDFKDRGDQFQKLVKGLK